MRRSANHCSSILAVHPVKPLLPLTEQLLGRVDRWTCSIVATWLPQPGPPDGAGFSRTTIDIAAAGGVSAGETKVYQLWYRNPTASPCGSGFNLTNGFAVSWAP